MSPRPFDDYRNTPLWSALQSAFDELVASGEVAVNTAPEYVIGYVCRELVAKKLIVLTGYHE